MSFDSVVRIVVPMSSGSRSSGSGFVIDTTHILPDHPGTFFLTNGHVVDGSETSTVKIHTTFEARSLDARVVSISYDADLALLELCPSAREYCKQTYGPDVWKPLDFVSKPPACGTKIVCVGHPLGIERQTVAKGEVITYMATSDPNTVAQTVAMTNTVCNPGCSGGPAMLKEGHLVVGMNSFKLRNDTVDGMSGIRPAHVITQLLPAMLAPIAQYEEQRKEALTVLKSMLGKSAGNVLQFLPGHVQDVSTVAQTFKDHAIGGRCDGSNARTLRSFLRRHVIDVDVGTHGTIRPGGAAVLTRALAVDHEETRAWRAGRTWTKVRAEEAAQPLASVLPAVPQPPSLVSMPILGVLSHGTHDASLCNYYLSKTSQDGATIGQGGAVVTNVLRKSMYDKAGGKEHEIIHSVTVGATTYDIGVDGKAKCADTATRITVRDIVCRQSLGSVVKFNVLTPDGDLLTRECEVAVPTFDEIPHVHMQHSTASSQMLRDQQENMNIGGVVLTTLRLNHATQLNMTEFADEEARYNWHAIVAHISPTSPIYGHSGIEVGSLITHVNEEPVTTEDWNAFCTQLQAAVESGHLRLKTKLGPKRGLFAAITK